MKYSEDVEIVTTIEDGHDLLELDEYESALKRILEVDGVWVIRAKTWKVSLKAIRDYLFNLGFDIFDLDLLSKKLYKLYVCPIDSRRIQNSVVFALKSESSNGKM